MAKKIGGLEEDVLITGGLVVGGYLLIKNLLPNFFSDMGVSDADRSNLDNQQTTPAQTNIFNPGYQSSANWAVQNYDWSHFDTSTAYLQNAFNDYKHGNMSPTNPIYATMQIYYNLYPALIGHIMTGDQAGINAALNSITNKWQVGVIAELFADINNKDFWELLRNGAFPMRYGLNGTDLSAQLTRLNNLPE